MLTIRQAFPTDAVLLSEMGSTSYRYHFAHLWQKPDELQDFLEQEFSLPTLQSALQIAESPWFIAQAPHPIGFAKVTWHQAIDNDCPAGTLLHKLYLLPDKTGKGYGEELFKEIVQMAQLRGERFFWLEVLEANTKALAFYHRQGLQPIKDRIFRSASQQSKMHILGKAI